LDGQKYLKSGCYAYKYLVSDAGVTIVYTVLKVEVLSSGFMLDKSVPYYDVLMKREKGATLPLVALAEGFRFVFYKAGDENEWAEIEASVGEFSRAVDALVYF
jgi:hypothetical protein